MRSVAYGRLRVYVMYFPAHYASVTDMFAHDKLSPALKIYRRHRPDDDNNNNTVVVVVVVVLGEITNLVGSVVQWPMRGR